MNLRPQPSGNSGIRCPAGRREDGLDVPGRDTLRDELGQAGSELALRIVMAKAVQQDEDQLLTRVAFWRLFGGGLASLVHLQEKKYLCTSRQSLDRGGRRCVAGTTSRLGSISSLKSCCLDGHGQSVAIRTRLLAMKM